MKRIHIVIIVFLIVLSGCNNKKNDNSISEYSCPSYDATHIQPNFGHWRFTRTDNDNILENNNEFTVRKSDNNDNPQLGVLGWAYYVASHGGYGGYPYPTYGSLEIVNGAFRFQWGCVFEYCRHCPSDGFCFSGHFLSPTKAEGSVEWYPCESSPISYWEAEWISE